MVREWGNDIKNRPIMLAQGLRMRNAYSKTRNRIGALIATVPKGLVILIVSRYAGYRVGGESAGRGTMLGESGREKGLDGVLIDS